MQIRYVSFDDEKRTDQLLADLARRAAAAGITLAGTIQPVDPSRGHCDIVLGLLPDGAARPISVNLPADVPGCRLDPEAFEAVVAEVHDRLPTAQGLVVNKFGKQEAAGRGLVTAIGEACERDLPVLIGVSPVWRDAFLGFDEGSASPFADDEDRIFEWLRAACKGKADRSQKESTE